MAPAGYGDRVEGVHAVTAALRAGRVERLYVEKGRRESAGQLLSLIGDESVQMVDDVRDFAETRAPQGVVARCRPITPVTLEGLAGEAAAVIALDHIEDPQNLGAIARSAVGAGCTGLLMSSRRAAPLSAAAFKAAAGALETVPVSVVSSIPEALKRLKQLGVWIVGLDAAGEQSLFGLDLLTEPVAVVIGAEGSGIAPLTARRCDVIVSIPMAAGFESLNASVSAALAAFEIMRVRTAAID